MKNHTQLMGLLLVVLYSLSASAAISIDRTRLVFAGHQSSASMLVSNEMPHPYLLQSWVESETGEKITSPLMALPPLQRVDAKQKKFIQVQRIDPKGLPTDRESLFYLNILEVPPQAEDDHVLQIAFQSRLKIFYRPKGLAHKGRQPWQQALQLSIEGNELVFNNPTAFYIVIVFLGEDEHESYPAFTEMVLKPHAAARYQPPRSLGDTVHLSYMDDTGASRPLSYRCVQGLCALLSPQKEP